MLTDQSAIIHQHENNSNHDQQLSTRSKSTCNKPSSTPNSINNNNSSAKTANTKVTKHSCNWPDCSWSFKRLEHLKRHMITHTGERKYTCIHPGCGKRFGRSDNFAAHSRTHYKNDLNGISMQLHPLNHHPHHPPIHSHYHHPHNQHHGNLGPEIKIEHHDNKW
ncbi:11480_t:CDS:2 [Entrophospora sp. SA101]|nr:11480_t:CDS:2 [Entrophospora sp. SA101]CAJ0921273.1 14920_t:CDS:2 [Entrophospora sp. SA101]